MKRRTFIAGTLAFFALQAEATAQAKPRRIGVLIARPENDPEGQKQFSAFQRKLTELGWTPGGNLEVAVRWEVSDPAQRLAFIKELVAFKPDVLVINSSGYLRAALPEVGAIPVVFVAIADPVAQGFVQGLSRPGGTLTGFGAEEPSMGAKWMELLKEVAPNTRTATVIYNPNTAPTAPLFISSIDANKASFGLSVRSSPVQDESELRNAIVKAAQQPSSGLIFLADSFLASRPALVADAVAASRLPAVYSIAAFPRNGGLIALGIERAAIFGRAAGYVDRILKGENPSTLPVEMPDKLELVVNLKTAKSLGLSVAPAILARADEVIE
jgi:putative tryptophan/tyrosine transport system substrate-binding protein